MHNLSSVVSAILRKSFKKVVLLEQKFDSYKIKFKPDGTFYGLNEVSEIAKGKPARLSEKELFALYAKGKQKSLKKQTLFNYESTALKTKIEGYKLGCKRYVGERSEEIALLACQNKRVDILAKAGQGKTTAAAKLMLQLDAKRVLFFVPTIGLAQQTAQALKSNTALKDFDIIEVHSQSGQNEVKSPKNGKIVVATYDQIKELRSEIFELLIIDEIHQLISEADYRHKAVNSLLAYRAAHHARNANAISIGLTATPNPLNYSSFCRPTLNIAAAQIWDALELRCDKEEFAANLQLDTVPILVEAAETQKLNINQIAIDRTRQKVSTSGKNAAQQSHTLQLALANIKEAHNKSGLDKTVHLLELNDSTTNKALVSLCEELGFWAEEINSAQKLESKGYLELIQKETLSPLGAGVTVYFVTKLLECGINCKSSICSIHAINPPTTANILQFFARPRMQANGTNKELNCFIYRPKRREKEQEERTLKSAKAELNGQLQKAIADYTSQKRAYQLDDVRTQHDSKVLANSDGPKLAAILFSVSQAFYSSMDANQLKEDLERLNSSAKVELIEDSKRSFKSSLDDHKAQGKAEKEAAQKSLANLMLSNKELVKAALLAVTQTDNVSLRNFLTMACAMPLTAAQKEDLKESYSLEFGPATKGLRTTILKAAATIAKFCKTYPDAEPNAYFNTLLDKAAQYHLEQNKEAKAAAKLELNHYEQKFAFERRQFEFKELCEKERKEHLKQKQLFKSIYKKVENNKAGKSKPLTKGWIDGKAAQIGLSKFDLSKVRVLAACYGFALKLDGKRATKNSKVKLITKEFKHEYL